MMEVDGIPIELSPFVTLRNGTRVIAFGAGFYEGIAESDDGEFIVMMDFAPDYDQTPTVPMKGDMKN